jgi:hypothetical protein
MREINVNSIIQKKKQVTQFSFKTQSDDKKSINGKIIICSYRIIYV